MVTEQELKSKVDFLKKELSSLVDQNKDVELQTQKRLNKLFDRVDGLDSWSAFIESLDDLPGIRQPKWYKIEVPFGYEEKQEQSGQVQISASGPFVCTQMQSYFRITDTDPLHYPYRYDEYFAVNSPPPSDTVRVTNAAGRLVAPSTYFGLRNRLAYFERFASWGINAYIKNIYSKENFLISDNWWEGYSYPEFDVRIQTANNNDFWTGLDSIPAAALYGTENPLYLAIPSIVQASDSIVCFAKPMIPQGVPLQGVYTLVLHGYHIGLHANLEDLGV